MQPAPLVQPAPKVPRGLQGLTVQQGLLARKVRLAPKEVRGQQVLRVPRDQMVL